MEREEWNVFFDEWWEEEEKGLPPMFQNELAKRGIYALTKIAFHKGIGYFADKVITPLR